MRRLHKLRGFYSRLHPHPASNRKWKSGQKTVILTPLVPGWCARPRFFPGVGQGRKFSISFLKSPVALCRSKLGTARLGTSPRWGVTMLEVSLCWRRHHVGGVTVLESPDSAFGHWPTRPAGSAPGQIRNFFRPMGGIRDITWGKRLNLSTSRIHSSVRLKDL